MNEIQLVEGNLTFTFVDFLIAEKFDENSKNAAGMYPVDFLAESNAHLYLIEVKDFQNPKATEKQRKEDYQMLTGKDEHGYSIFAIKMGGKIKDSLLRKFALGYKYTKAVKYLLFVNLDGLGEHEWGRLKEKIRGHIPTGLNDDRFCEFTDISFELVYAAEQFKPHGIICTANDAV